MTHLLACKPMRRMVAMLVALCALVPMAEAITPSADESDAQRAAREIADARERANQAADAYFSAESALDGLEVEASALEIEIADSRIKVGALQERVQQVAVNRFTRSSAAASPLLNGFASAEEQMQVSALTEVITDTSEGRLRRFRLAQPRPGSEERSASCQARRDRIAAG